MKNHFVIAACVLPLLNLGCSASKFASGTTSTPTVTAEGTSCIDPMPYTLSANVFDFEMSRNVGGKISILNILELNFSVQSGQLLTDMNLLDTSSGEKLISVTGTGKYTSTDDGIDVNVGQYGVGFDYISQTPIGTLAKRSVQDGLTQIDTQLASWGNKWSTFITSIAPDGNLMLSVGARAGLRMGDQFEIYNVNQDWASGTPCSGPYTITPTTKTPIAIATVAAVVGDAAALQITSQASTSVPVVTGAAVYVHQLTGKKRAALKSPIRLLPVQGNPLVFANGQTVDFKSFLQNQFEAIVSADSFYIQ